MSAFPNIVLAAILLAATPGAVNADWSRSVESLPVERLDPVTRAPLPSRAPLPVGTYQVWIVLDPGQPGAGDLLRRLEQAEYDGSGATVLLLTREGQSDRTGAQAPKARLPQATWAQADALRVLGGLDLSGTPLLLGIDPAGRVRWLRAGESDRIQPWLDAIEDWTRRQPRAPEGDAQ